MWRIGPVLKHCKSSKILSPGLYAVYNQLVTYVLFLTYLFNISRSRSRLLCEKCIENFCKLYRQKTLCWGPILTSCRPKACNCIKIKSPVQALSSNFCETSQNNFLQNNREQLLLVVEWCYGKLYSRKFYFWTGRKLCQSAVLLKLPER